MIVFRSTKSFGGTKNKQKVNINTFHCNKWFLHYLQKSNWYKFCRKVHSKKINQNQLTLVNFSYGANAEIQRMLLNKSKQ